MFCSMKFIFSKYKPQELLCRLYLKFLMQVPHIKYGEKHDTNIRPQRAFKVQPKNVLT